MGLRVDLAPPDTVGYGENPVTSNLVGTMQRMNAPLDTLGYMGDGVHGTLNSASAAYDGFESNPRGSMEPNLDVRLGQVNGALGVAVRTGPPRAMQDLSGVARRTSGLASMYKGAFSSSRESISGTKMLGALALGVACMLVSSLLQALMGKISDAMLRSQRTALAMMDKMKKQAIKAVEKAVSAMMEALPDCPQSVKDVARELRSILGKASTMVAAVNSLMMKGAACLALGGLVGLALSNRMNRIVSLADIVSKSKFLVVFDFSQFESQLDTGFDEHRADVYNNQQYYHNTSYLNDTITAPLQEAIDEATAAQDEVEVLIGEVQPEDSTEYKNSLDTISNILDGIIQDLTELKDNLKDETLGIIDGITDHTNNALNQVQEDLEKDIKEVQEEVEAIFDSLEKAAKEFDSPEVQEKILTSCADTAVRTIIDNNP